MKSKAYFISGIDTDCGKTHITSQLALWLINQGFSTITQKPVQTGCTRISDDIKAHRNAMGIGLQDEDTNGITCSYLFEKPASPHLAAFMESEEINIETIKQHTQQLMQKYERVLIEGAGGLMVPLSTDLLTIDYIKESNIPLILVSNNKLGSINHTLLSIGCCLNHQIELHTLIYNRFPDEDKLITDDSIKVITNYLRNHSPKTRVVDFSTLSDFNGWKE